MQIQQATAQTAGVFALREEDPAELESAISPVLAHDGPALLDLVTHAQELSMPLRIEVAQAKEFSRRARRVVLSGREDERVDLPVCNFLNR